MGSTIEEMELTLRTIARLALLATALTPVVMSTSVLLSYTLPKLVFFRSMILVAFAAWLGSILVRAWKGQHLSYPSRPHRLRASLIIALIAFMLIAAISAGLADHPYRAFWGDIERAEGIFGMLHYYAFFFLSLAIFARKDWMNFFKISIAVGTVMIVVAFAEYFRSNARPISLVGNPAFLAAYFIFLIMATGIVWGAEKARFYKNSALAVGLASVVGVYLTGTRGAILGLAAGVLLVLFASALARGHRTSRILAGILLVAGLVFGATFIVTREYQIWQHLPGFDRLARTSFLDPDDPSTQTRIIAWRTSFEAFKERPLLGWGPDNYVVAYQLHYDPSLAKYGETWLDRAHNKIFDLLVMYGALGTVAYFVMIAAIFALAFRPGAPYRMFLIGGFAAYLVQNLFLMDQILSHLGFFAFAAFLMQDGPTSNAGAGKTIPQAAATPIMIFLVLGIGSALYGLYAWNYVPYRQARILATTPKAVTVKAATDALRSATQPYNFAQFELRAHAFDTVYLEGFVRDSAARSLADHKIFDDALLQMLRETRLKEPYDVRTALREAQLLDAMAENDPLYYKEIETLLHEAISRAPSRQELHYQLALAQMKQEHFGEASETARHAIELAPDVARAHFYFGVVAAAAGQQPEAQKALEEAERLDPDLSHFLGTDHNLLLAIYSEWGYTDKVADLVLQSIRGDIVQSFELRHLQTAMRNSILREDADGVIAVAEYLKRNPQFAEDMGTIIELAKQGSWDVLRTL